MLAAPEIDAVEAGQIALAAEQMRGPDLRELPTLSDQLDALDRVRAAGDITAYVIAWLAISDQLGGGAHVLWLRDDPPDALPRLISGYSFDSQEVQRRLRWQALHDHHDGVADFSRHLADELIAHGRVFDNRLSKGDR